ncbi:TIGR01440 family protein [Metabacillus fastidiosus]|uniref:TIGR01440 family protein n=1 Tax=Metabacillus fastidiosus TaxID=1458 RepID=UPI002E1A8CE9|nr:TIGR01440 family protein [Metabacillus fastidiosus]
MAIVDKWREQLNGLLHVFEREVSGGDLVVIGCSTSEVIGQKIGTAGTEEVAEMIYEELQKFREKTAVHLVFQCCEHLNRALVLESDVAEQYRLEEVSVIPVRTAGGAMATYAYKQMRNPAVVEFVKADAGIDIGDTFIGMHLKHVAVPVRSEWKEVGQAHVTMAKTRPKLIGGARAVYEQSTENNSCH